MARRNEICGLCWPNGWPTADTYDADCEHGHYSRPVPKALKQAAPEPERPEVPEPEPEDPAPEE